MHSIPVRIAIFGTEVLREERIVVVAEQRPDCTEDEVYHDYKFPALYIAFVIVNFIS